ncbi:disulfide oxidoreductase [Ectobacillus ponti]|uniref:Probable disulfide formation protein n=1 Tax=Ectobacillus ponti TaxID=2961894 RepID=A0AA41X7M4_9BACI|nr:disulfide oxidoreductase [Ectobacillus ponti]MCP8968149.1 disulfide oxidoreductase [Ectobacillus ponti]
MNQETKKEYTLFTAWAAALTATLGSLYLSEVMKYEPCTLCWYQRILMYPLVIVLGVALFRKDYRIYVYSLPLAGIGACISLYHYAMQKIPALSQSGLACGRIPCTGDYLNWFHFITIPLLALLAFLLITGCSVILMREANKGGYYR